MITTQILVKLKSGISMPAQYTTESGCSAKDTYSTATTKYTAISDNILCLIDGENTRQVTSFCQQTKKIDFQIPRSEADWGLVDYCIKNKLFDIITTGVLSTIAGSVRDTHFLK